MVDNSYIDFPSLIDHAMRDVVRRALQVVEKKGLPGEHHFFVSFRTEYPGVGISPALHGRHPNEMTIVLQHQFWDLKVEEERFSITLSFNSVPEKLVIPFQALTAFADPSVKFGLQFHTFLSDDTDDDLLDEDDLLELLERETSEASILKKEPTKKAAAKKAAKDDKVGGDDVVVTLDAFRKKSKKTDKKTD